jgi:hypothetical protein
MTKTITHHAHNVLLATAAPAYAYLDPGSGSMMVQLLLGGVAGAVVLVRLYWARLLTLLGLRRDRTDVDAKASR